MEKAEAVALLVNAISLARAARLEGIDGEDDRHNVIDARRLDELEALGVLLRGWAIEHSLSKE